MKLYKAELRIVKSDIGFFCQKQLLSEKRIGNYIGGFSNEVWRSLSGLCKGMYYYPILQTLYDYNRDHRYSKEGHSYTELEYLEKLREELQKSSNYDYWDNRFLVVSKQFPHKAKEITTGFTFPIVKSFFADNSGLYNKWVFEKFFRANQRIYVNILGEMSKEEIKEFANRIEEDDIKKRKQTLSFIIEDTKKDWRVLPSIEEVKKFILQTQFMRDLQDILEDRKQTELEKKETKQYVKMIEQKRKDV